MRRTRLIILTISYVVSVCQSEKCFRPTISCPRRPGCVLDVPSEMLEKVDSQLFCAHACKSREACVSFNYLKMSRSCLLFDSTPYKIKYTENCCGYDMVSECEDIERPIHKGENLAKFKRSCMSSIKVHNNINLWSWLALDGLHGTGLQKGECSSTSQGDSSNNWFMVDLVQLVSISYVRVLSTVTTTQNAIKYKDLTVGVTNTSWLVSSPIRGTYPLCGVYLGPPPNGTWMDISCMPSIPPSRFSIVHQVPAHSMLGGHLPVCELEIYGV